MKIKVQYCWGGGENLYFRALVCGGIQIPTENAKWTRKHAIQMLDALELNGLDRKKIRFVHV